MKSGIINVYKEAGYTSFDVVARLRGILKTKKIGHTGTLDPDATGVLPVCIGKATKLCDLLTDKDKVYECVMLLGKTTDTLDISGKVLSETPVPAFSDEEIHKAVGEFVGDIMQVPPMYSALKVDGKKLYELARAGVEVERKPRPVHIFEIDILSIDLPRVTMSIHCSKGTYIRSLCDDIGKALGCGACMESLVRTRVSRYKIQEAKTLQEIQEIVNAGHGEDVIFSIDSAFDYPKVTVSESAIVPAVNGGILYKKDCSQELEGNILLYLPDGRFIGVFHGQEDCYKLDKMFLED